MFSCLHTLVAHFELTDYKAHKTEFLPNYLHSALRFALGENPNYLGKKKNALQKCQNSKESTIKLDLRSRSRKYFAIDAM